MAARDGAPTRLRSERRSPARTRLAGLQRETMSDIARRRSHGEREPEAIDIFRHPLVATRSGRPRPFNKKRRTGTSDHLPLTAVLRY